MPVEGKPPYAVKAAMGRRTFPLRTRSPIAGLALGMVLLGVTGFTAPSSPAPPGVRGETSWAQYQTVLHHDAATLANPRGYPRAAQASLPGKRIRPRRPPFRQRQQWPIVVLGLVFLLTLMGSVGWGQRLLR